MTSTALQSTVAALLAPHKGLLAADESLKTIGKRFAALGIESTEASRRAYRTLLFTTPNLAEHVSGAILFDETLRQEIDGVPMPAALAAKGIVAGIKVDRGTEPMPGSTTETFTQGLHQVEGRLQDGVGPSDVRVRRGQRQFPGALCRTLPGGRARPDR